MATRTLNDAEMDRIRAELGFPTISISALPYIPHAHIFNVIRDNVKSTYDVTTSSSTVSAAGPTTITVADSTNISQFTRVVIDCDAQRETVTVRNVSTLTLSIVASKTHSGTYPVEVETQLTLVRQLVEELTALGQIIRTRLTSSGVKKVEEIEFFGDATWINSSLGHLYQTQERMRQELAERCGLSTLLRGQILGEQRGSEIY